MSVQKITKIAILASIQSVVFLIFSQVLYLEGITFVVCLFACAFDREEAVFASLTFGFVTMFIQGVTIWTMMYALIYPIYSFVLSLQKNYLVKHPLVLMGWCGFFSFLTGQLLEIPFLLFSKEVTIFYLILGLKTSVIQGFLSAILCVLLFEPCYKILKKIEGRTA